MLTARDQLIVDHTYLVPSTVARVVKHVPPGIERDDLESEGYVALVKAADRFDSERGVKFTTWAITMIRGAVLQFLRAEDWTPRSVRDKQKRGEPVQILQLVSLEEYLGAAASDDNDLLYRIDCIADPAVGPQTLTLEADERERLWWAVDGLPKSERFVMQQYYREGFTYKEIAAFLGRSESRVRQLHWQAKTRLHERGWVTAG